MLDRARQRMPQASSRSCPLGGSCYHPLAADAQKIAHLLSVSESLVRQLDRSGRLPSPIRFGRRKVWCVDELRDWLRAGTPHRQRLESHPGGEAVKRPSPSALSFYLALWERWGRNGKRCWESQANLAKQFNVSVRQINRREKELRELGWIKVHRLRRGFSSRQIEFLHHPDTEARCTGTPDEDKAAPARQIRPVENITCGHSGPDRQSRVTSQPDQYDARAGHSGPPNTRTTRTHKNSKAAAHEKPSEEVAKLVRGLGFEDPGFAVRLENALREDGLNPAEATEALVEWAVGRTNPPGALRAALDQDYATSTARAELKQRAIARARTTSEERIQRESNASLTRDREKARAFEEQVKEPRLDDPDFLEGCQMVMAHPEGSYKAMKASIILAGEYRVKGEAHIRQLVREAKRRQRSEP